MHKAIRLERVLICVLLVLCVAMTGANIYLLKMNKAFRSKPISSRAVVPVGTFVNEVTGLTSNDQKITVLTKDKHATVLMIYSPICHYCEQNWANWNSVISQTVNRGVDFEVIDLTSSAAPEFVSTKISVPVNSIHRLNPNDVVRLNLNLTPETIVVGGDSRVKKSWAGVLSPADVAELVKMIS